MAKFYIRYTPARRGLTGAEYIQEFLDQYHPSISWDSVISDGAYHYGILEGSGDELSKALVAIKGRFSASRMNEDAFVGAAYVLYNPISEPDMPDPPSFTDFMASHGITVSGDMLEQVKAFKTTLFKDIVKNRFSTWNDSLSAIAKSVALLVLHYNDLSTEDKTTVDNLSTTLKSIYSQDICITAYQEMIEELQNILQSYYIAKSNVESATTVDDAMSVVFE